MIVNLADADAEMADLFNEVWVNTTGYPCVWPNSKSVDVSKEPIWAHWSLNYTGGNQLTFGPKGRRKFDKIGAVVIVVFTPFGNGLKESRDIAQLAVSAYEGQRTPSGVTFRNVRIETEGQGQAEQGSVGWWATAVVAPFRYEYLR